MALRGQRAEVTQALTAGCSHAKLRIAIEKTKARGSRDDELWGPRDMENMASLSDVLSTLHVKCFPFFISFQYSERYLPLCKMDRKGNSFITSRISYFLSHPSLPPNKTVFVEQTF